MISPLARLRPALAAALVLLAAAAPPRAAAAPFRVVTWNLEWFPGWEPECTPEKAAQHVAEVKAALRRLHPDVLIAVEVKDPQALASALSGVTGMSVQAVSEFPGRPQQVAICSRFPARRTGWGTWAQAVAGPPRGFAFAELQVASNALLRVTGLHWKSNRGVMAINQSLRVASALQLDYLAQSFTNPPGMRVGTLLTGDLNTSLDDDEMAADASLRYLIGRGWYWPFGSLTPDERKTWQGRSHTPSIQFDHFLLRGAGHPKAFVGETGHISDHLPVIVTLHTDEIGRGP